MSGSGRGREELATAQTEEAQAARRQLVGGSARRQGPCNACVCRPAMPPLEGQRMAEVTRRRTGEFLRKLFEILMPHPDGLLGRDALAKLQSHVKLTDYEAGNYESGKQRFEQIVRFATVDCGK